MAIEDSGFFKNFSSFRGLHHDIEQIRAAGRNPVTQTSASGQAQLSGLSQDRQRDLANLKGQQAGRFATNQNQLALTGGLSAGANERLASQGQRDAGLFSQLSNQDFQRQATGIRAQDFAQQQALKERAMFESPNLSNQLFNQEATQAFAQQRAALGDDKPGLFANIAGIGVGAATTYFTGGNVGAGLAAGGATRQALS